MIEIEFENSSHNNSAISKAIAENKTNVNIIDRLLFERDSQFSNFNSKIDRLRHGGGGNSMSSFSKEHRKSSH